MTGDFRQVKGSPTDQGMSPSIGFCPPDSYTMVMFGAWVFFARMAATMGRPVPT